MSSERFSASIGIETMLSSSTFSVVIVGIGSFLGSLP